MRSHILIPKSVFKEFANEKDYFFKYDIKKNIIARGFPRSTYVEEDYYSKEMEEILNQNIETQLKELLVFAKSFISDKEEVEVKKKIIEIAQNYLYSLVARNPNMCKSISENSIFAQFMPKQSIHDFTIDLAMRHLYEQNMLGGFDLAFLINKTSIPFVLPTRGLVEIQLNGVACMYIPLNPHFALLFKQKEKDIYQKGEVFLIIPAGLEKQVNCFNSVSFIKQRRDGEGFVISEDKYVLKLLLNETEDAKQ